MIMLFYCREMMDMEPLYWLMTLNSLANPWVYLAFNWNLLCLGRLRRGSNSDTQMWAQNNNVKQINKKIIIMKPLGHLRGLKIYLILVYFCL